jgi:transaldolase
MIIKGKGKCHSYCTGVLLLAAMALTAFSNPALAFLSPRAVLRTNVGDSSSIAAAAAAVTTATATSALHELAKMTTLSIDTGDLDLVAKFARTGLITDATTNPAIVNTMSMDARYQEMVLDAIAYAKLKTGGGDAVSDNPEALLNLAMDKLAVNLGVRMSQLVPGRVSTEVDIRLSYDTAASVERAVRIIAMYQEMGVPRNRVLIKLAGTWEGIQAAAILEQKYGIQCNITLIFSFLQAAAAAQAGAYLVSPFPGRIWDWHCRKTGRTSYHPAADPGVLTVKRIYAYLLKYKYKTVCMPSSWRPSRGADVPGSELDEILALAGVGEMTIPPALLEALASRDAVEVKRECLETDAAASCDPNFVLTKEAFDLYWDVDECGKEKLAEGIEAFTMETNKLREMLIPQFA